MVHKFKLKAHWQQQAEFAEVLFIAVLETGDDEDHGLDTDFENDKEWQPLDVWTIRLK